MKHEHSAGGAVYKESENGLVWLIGKHSGYHKWVLPKGRIESGETTKEAAIREVSEETGIIASIVGDEPIHTEEYEYQADFSEGRIHSVGSGQVSHGGAERRVMTYQESGGKQEWVKKDVSFFLMKYSSGDIKDHSFEMEEVEWLEYDKAIERLEFDGERNALEKARREVRNIK